MAFRPERHLVQQLVPQVRWDTLGDLLGFVVRKPGNFGALLEGALPVRVVVFLEAKEEGQVVFHLGVEVDGAGLRQDSLKSGFTFLAGKVPLISDFLLLS